MICKNVYYLTLRPEISSFLSHKSVQQKRKYHVKAKSHLYLPFKNTTNCFHFAVFRLKHGWNKAFQAAFTSIYHCKSHLFNRSALSATLQSSLNCFSRLCHIKQPQCSSPFRLPGAFVFVLNSLTETKTFEVFVK